MLSVPSFGFHEYPLYMRTPLADSYNNHRYNVAIDVPYGIKTSDIKVSIENHGKYLHIYGTSKYIKSNGKMISPNTFDKEYTIASNTDINHIRAKLSHGVLYVSAPKKTIN